VSVRFSARRECPQFAHSSRRPSARAGGVPGGAGVLFAGGGATFTNNGVAAGGVMLSGDGADGGAGLLFTGATRRSRTPALYPAAREEEEACSAALSSAEAAREARARRLRRVARRSRMLAP
jgi:hypothetical protein